MIPRPSSPFCHHQSPPRFLSSLSHCCSFQHIVSDPTSNSSKLTASVVGTPHARNWSSETGPPEAQGSLSSLPRDLGKSLHLQGSLFPHLCNRNNIDLLYELRSTDERAGRPSAKQQHADPFPAPPLPRLLRASHEGSDRANTSRPQHPLDMPPEAANHYPLCKCKCNGAKRLGQELPPLLAFIFSSFSLSSARVYLSRLVLRPRFYFPLML